MPSWFAGYAVDRQDQGPNSTLSLYRQALHLRRDLTSTETIAWHDGPTDVVWFSRDNGWHCFTNVGTEPVAMPKGVVLLASAPTSDTQVPGETSVWLRV